MANTNETLSTCMHLPQPLAQTQSAPKEVVEPHVILVGSTPTIDSPQSYEPACESWLVAPILRKIGSAILITYSLICGRCYNMVSLATQDDCTYWQDSTTPRQDNLYHVMGLWNLEVEGGCTQVLQP